METMVMTTQDPALHPLPGARPPVLPAAALRRVDDSAARQACESLLRQACAPSPLVPPTPAAWAAMAEAAQRHGFGTGQLVLERDQRAEGLWLVGSGLVALGTRGDGGLLQHRRSVGAGCWLDLASGLLGAGHAEDAVAETDGQLWHWPAAAWQRLLRQHPALQGLLLATLAAEVHALIESTRGLMMKSVLARCATWLLAHAEFQPAEGGAAGSGLLHLGQRKRTIALQLGTTAETFSRTLHQLKREALIDVRGYDIRLLDVEGLRRLAGPR
jgi:CRP-like cAMP-binding protein